MRDALALCGERPHVIKNLGIAARTVIRARTFTSPKQSGVRFRRREGFKVSGVDKKGKEGPRRQMRGGSTG